MADNDPKTPQDDEVILCVRYTDAVSWLIGIGFLSFSVIFHRFPYYFALEGDYVRAILCSIGLPLMFGIGVEVLFTKHILFFSDKLVKVWHFLGRRTIPYSRAKMHVNPSWYAYVGWSTRAFRVQETDNTGTVRLIQIPILFCSPCVSPGARDKVEAIMSYLVGMEDSSRLFEESRRLSKFTLREGILGQDQAKTDSSAG